MIDPGHGRLFQREIRQRKQEQPSPEEVLIGIAAQPTHPLIAAMHYVRWLGVDGTIGFLDLLTPSGLAKVDRRREGPFPWSAAYSTREGSALFVALYRPTYFRQQVQDRHPVASDLAQKVLGDVRAELLLRHVSELEEDARIDVLMLPSKQCMYQTATMVRKAHFPDLPRRAAWLPNADQRRIIDLLLPTGAPYSEIITAVGDAGSRPGINSFRAYLDLTNKARDVPGPGRPRNQERDLLICTEYQQGTEVPALAKKHDLSKARIYQILRANGANDRAEGSRTEQWIDALVMLLLDRPDDLSDDLSDGLDKVAALLAR